MCFTTEGSTLIIIILQSENIWKNKVNQNVMAEHTSLPSDGQSLSVSHFCYQGAHKMPITPQLKQSILLLTCIMTNLVKTDEIYGF